jgi:hypothetical protein
MTSKEALERTKSTELTPLAGRFISVPKAIRLLLEHPKETIIALDHLGLRALPRV